MALNLMCIECFGKSKTDFLISHS